jgi:hypothetical protein
VLGGHPGTPESLTSERDAAGETCYAPTKSRNSISIVKRHLAEQEERLVLVEEICIDKGALVMDPATEEVYFSRG